MSDSCLFCRIIHGEIPSELIYEDDRVIAFNDINPQAPNHFLIVPKKHIATLNDLSSEEIPLIGHMLLISAELAKKEGFSEAGYRTVFNCNAQAGQTIFHLHLHVLGGRALEWPPG